MTDELTPDPPDQRDERVAELLEVPPLDDVTRRRLVTHALEAAGDGAGGAGEARPATPSMPRGRRILAVAAAAVAVIAVSAGVISALRDDGGSGSTSVAGRVEKNAALGSGGAETHDQSTPEAPATAPAAPETPSASQAAVAVALGELGDVTDAGRLRAVTRRALAGGDSRTEQDQPLAAASAQCLNAAPAGTTLVAAGTGRDQGAPVVVLVVAENLNAYRVLLLDPASCATRSSLDL